MKLNQIPEVMLEKKEHSGNCPLISGHLCKCDLGKLETICSEHGDYTCSCGTKQFNQALTAQGEVEVELDRKKTNLVLWTANNEWHNTHAENADGYFQYLITALSDNLPKILKVKK